MLYRWLSKSFASLAVRCERAAMFFLRKVKTAEHRKKYRRDYPTPPISPIRKVRKQ